MKTVKERKKYHVKTSNIGSSISRIYRTFIPTVKYIFVPEVNEEKMIIRKELCSHFGCKKELSLIEKLCGNICTKHMGENKIIINDGRL